jgi:3-deoxy-7-phosphoheptulonate synthase
MDINDNGQLCISNTNGNYDTQIILNNEPNYRAINIQQIKKICQHKNIVPKIIIDCSHNDSRNQQWVFKNVMKQINDGEKSIVGLMLESSIIETLNNYRFPAGLVCV